MAVQESHEPDYPAAAGYVLRRRERFWLGSIIFVYAFPGLLLTLVTIGYLTGYPSVAEVIYFGLFFLLAVPCGFWMWKERAAVAGQVLLAVDEGGIYLAGPPGGSRGARPRDWLRSGAGRMATTGTGASGCRAWWSCAPARTACPARWRCACPAQTGGARCWICTTRSSGWANWPPRCTPMRRACPCGDAGKVK